MKGRRKPASAQLQQLILEHLHRRQAAYHSPVASTEIARDLRICASYVREQARLLVLQGVVRARRGPFGGYYLRPPFRGQVVRPPRAPEDGARPPDPEELVACLQALVLMLRDLADELAEQLKAISEGRCRASVDWGQALAGIAQIEQGAVELRRGLAPA